LGLLAKKTVVYTVIAPQGILWAGNHTAHVIFVLAISKTDYESAMALYDLFIALIRQKLPASLMSSTDFMTFKTSICEPA
jgi:mannitol/fructose-specific phosphotransferase system IIA component